MANVKITELVELAAADVGVADVFPIVDVSADATKKVTIASLRTTIADANDFATYTILYANVNTVQGNVAAALSAIDVVQDNVAAGVTESTAIEARRAANIAGAVSTITTGNLATGRALISDGSGKVAVSAVTSTEIGYVDGVTSAIQTQLDTKIATTASASNDFITYTQLTANINLVQDNVVAASGAADVEVRRVANIQGAVSTITTADLTASKALVSDGSGKVAVLASVTSTELAFLDATSSVQTQLDTKIATTVSASNDFVTYTRLDANINIVSANTAAVETKRVANIAGAVSTITTADLTASRAVVSDSSGKVAVSAVTSTEVGHLDGVTSALQTQLNDINTRATANAASSGAADAVEVRRVANIAGAVSTITTGNLTASKALVSDGSGKVSASAVTATELGYVDGVTSAIQTQIDSKQATITGAATTIDDTNLTASRAVVSDGSGKVAVSVITSTEIGYLDGVTSALQTQLNTKAPLAGATFTGQVNMGDDLVVTGNLTVNGETTTVNSENKIIQDRFIMLANAVSGAPSADVGIFFNRGTSGNAAIYYDESAKFFRLSETRDPDSNVVVNPTGAANLAVGQFTASSIESGAIQLNSTFVQGTDDQGYDLKLFGDTSGAFLLWDTSADTLGVTGAAKIDITKDRLLIGGTTVTTTATEVNQLDAITRGSIIYGNASGATARLAIGSADKVLTSDGTDISWEDASGGGMGYSVDTTIIDPPGSTSTDLGDVTNTGDAFGQRIHPSYDLMDPNGSVITTDLGAL